ncbi:aminotransferase class V-fold PLP-dependent enzyme [Fusibacter bizertensis]
MTFDKASIRALFPVTENYIFLNNAAESPMNLAFRDALDAFNDVACEAPQDKPSVRWALKEKLAALLGGKAEDYALMTSTGMGTGIVASGMSFEAGDNVVLPVYEHRNNLFPWLALKEKGVELRLIPVAEDGKIELRDLERLVDERTKIVAIAAVRFNSGFRIDLKKVGEIVHKKNALLYVDGIQACGIVPMHVETMGIDILGAAGFKWLLGVPGTGFLYVNAKARKLIKPSLPGMFAAEDSYEALHYFEDSRKYETGSIAYSLFYAWRFGLDIIINTGISAIYEEVMRLTDLLIVGFQNRGIKILSSIENAEERSAILFFTLGSEEKNNKLQEALQEKKVIISVRDGKCRISPSFYNTSDEISYFFEILDSLIDINQ